ncbi:hypothetical protein HBI56_073650 [Parastagonospora nodorum]|uniref:Uncharacterized protein n=1 Tax=Phaeosphaeria nodorum (strain SN15 / ATCC MYA-4574 / FGSC 10173) TaxID=321614 RepID=A0A7U2HXZ7_PHANO|nr:hypothetical protein HBH56_171330 [Parastagonospora nodorum]QRC94514.1 hypothetical protein JI435_405960 [Parastagonospora nodorum SN15]KAH3928596.1 hypothetical protein HBH54_139890 [Parastagonospora nodorum]KAH3945504.1 hypothetical protein HBH53_145240 [Parastagonospora nodorum]KAH3983686.1 hypothetical protein HBH52_058980 [Parastagonospora nodorum]
MVFGGCCLLYSACYLLPVANKELELLLRECDSVALEVDFSVMCPHLIKERAFIAESNWLFGGSGSIDVNVQISLAQSGHAHFIRGRSVGLEIGRMSVYLM